MIGQLKRNVEVIELGAVLTKEHLVVNKKANLRWLGNWIEVIELGPAPKQHLVVNKGANLGDWAIEEKCWSDWARRCRNSIFMKDNEQNFWCLSASCVLTSKIFRCLLTSRLWVACPGKGQAHNSQYPNDNHNRHNLRHKKYRGRKGYVRLLVLCVRSSAVCAIVQSSAGCVIKCRLCYHR